MSRTSLRRRRWRGFRRWTPARVTLVPLDDVTSAGVVALDDGVRSADPWQIVIDCYGGNGRMPDQVDAMA